MIYGFYGWKGSGKTLCAVLFAYLMYLSGKKVISNIRLFFPFEWINIKDIVELSPKLNNSFLLIDEIHMIADSRTPTALENRCITYFFLQSRHRDCDIGYTTQQASQCDIRIRKNTDIKIICENMGVDSDQDGINDIFHLIINNIVDKTTVEYSIYGEPVFEMYKSKEIVNPFLYINKQELKKLFAENVKKQQEIREDQIFISDKKKKIIKNLNKPLEKHNIKLTDRQKEIMYEAYEEVKDKKTKKKSKRKK